jgi:transposase-like protein
VAAVALANGLNANMLRRWVRESEVDTTAGVEVAQPRVAGSPAFVQLPMPAQPAVPAAPPEQTAARVEVEIQRNSTTVRASLPLDSCSAAPGVVLWRRQLF